MKLLSKISLFSLLLLLGISCKNKSESAVTGDAAAVKEMEGKDYIIDAEASKIMWSGSKITKTHMGTLNIAEGMISVNNEKLTGAALMVDMTSLTNTDQEGDGKAKLEGHLKSADFFDVAMYPTAKFEITKITNLETDANGNYLVYGNLTLKDVTKEVAFKSNVKIEGNILSVSSAVFKINRTDFGIKYGSSSFFDILKDKAINDEVGLSISVIAHAS